MRARALAPCQSLLNLVGSCDLPLTVAEFLMPALPSDLLAFSTTHRCFSPTYDMRAALT